MPFWSAPEYLEARIKEQEAERRLSEFQTRHVAEMKTPETPRLPLNARNQLSKLRATLSKILDTLEKKRYG